MPLPSRRLDLHLVPPDPDDHPRASADGLVDELIRLGMILPGGGPGPEAARWVQGGFGRLWVDDPGHVVLYANQQGGFRVRCPSCGENLVPVFGSALSAFRHGQPRRCTCPRCGTESPLEDLEFAPPAAFGRLSVVTADVSTAALTAEALALVADRLGDWRVVLRRP